MQSLSGAAIAAIATLLMTTLPAPPVAAELEESGCRLLHPLLPAGFGRCMTLRVPLDYDNPDGVELELFAARIPALTANPAPDPVVLINGGPGGSAVDLYLQLAGAFNPIRRDRDILLLEQRGTGRSLSGLECDIPDDFDLITASEDDIRSTVESCIGEFEHDPRFFTTSVAVRDLDALREALGIGQWNLYGVSYGTRVAQHYLRRYEPHVRTLILDGVVPPMLPLGPGIAGDAQAALDAILARCAALAPCAGRYPDLTRSFAELHERLRAEPVTVAFNDPVTGEGTTLALDATQLQGVVRLMSYNEATVALLPLIIDTAWRGNYQPLAAQVELQIESVNESLGFAMHNSVVCTEDAPWFPDDAQPETGAPYLGTSVVDGLRAICQSWPAGVIDDNFRQPVASRQPVLLLSGEHDPVTPPAYAEQIIAGGLDNARHLIGHSQGHGLVSVGCTPRLVRDFIESAVPDSVDPACLDQEPPVPFFLNFQGPAP